jgi:hypothetical protein
MTSVSSAVGVIHPPASTEWTEPVPTLATNCSILPTNPSRPIFRFRFPAGFAKPSPMGQQSNKIQKRKRREAYLKRKKEAAPKDKK